MKITFGKFNGWDTEALAKTTEGRNYLSWGASKLDSPKWRDEFQRALNTVSLDQIDIGLEAEAIMQGDPQIDPASAYRYAEEVKADALQKEQAFEALGKAEEKLRSDLKAAGVSDKGVNVLSNLITTRFNIEEVRDWEKVGKIQFTDRAKRDAVYAALNAYVAAVDAVKFY